MWEVTRAGNSWTTPSQANAHLALEKSTGVAHKASGPPARLWEKTHGPGDREPPLWEGCLGKQAGSCRGLQEAGSQGTQHGASSGHSSLPLPTPRTCFSTPFSGKVWRQDFQSQPVMPQPIAAHLHLPPSIFQQLVPRVPWSRGSCGCYELLRDMSKTGTGEPPPQDP